MATVAFLASGPVAAQVPSSGHVIVQVDRSRFPRVGLYVRSRAEPGAPVPALPRIVYEGPHPCATIDAIRRPSALGLVVVIDVRRSRGEWVPAVELALAGLAERLDPACFVAPVVVGPPDGAGVEFQRDRRALVHAAAAASDGCAPVLDALAEAWYACRQRPGRSAILLLSSGQDLGSVMRLSGLAELMAYTPAPLYAISLGPDTVASSLAQLAASTGGLAHAAAEPAELDALVRQVTDDLAALRPVWYMASDHTRDGGWRGVRLVPEPPDQSGYYAPASTDVCRPVVLSVAGPPDRERAYRFPFLVRREGGGAPAGAGMTGERAMLPPGTYQLRALTIPPHVVEGFRVSTEPDQQLSLPPLGEVEVTAPRTAGAVAFSVRDAESKAVVGEGVANLPVPLLPGRYRLESQGPVDLGLPEVSVTALARYVVPLAGRGMLTVQLRQPDDNGGLRDANADVYAYPVTPGQAGDPWGADGQTAPGPDVRKGSTNTPMSLAAGTYSLLIQTKPPQYIRNEVVRSGQDEVRELPPLGAVLLTLLDARGGAVSVSWVAQAVAPDNAVMRARLGSPPAPAQGGGARGLAGLGASTAATGVTNRPEPIVPGLYQVLVDCQPTLDLVCSVQPGRVSTVSMPQLAGLCVLLGGIVDESPLRIKFVLCLEEAPGVPVANGLTGGSDDVAMFGPGRYELVAWTAPEIRVPGIELVPGQTRTVELGSLAALRVDVGGRFEGRYVVRQVSPRTELTEVVGTYAFGRTVLIRPGPYLLEPVGHTPAVLSERVFVGGLTDGGALFIDPGPHELQVEVTRLSDGVPVGVFPAVTRIELAEGDYSLRPIPAGYRLPDTVRIDRRVLTVVPVISDEAS